MTSEEKEIELMLECAKKVKRHLTRVIQSKHNEANFQRRLKYVEDIIHQADVIKEGLVVCV